MARLNKHAAAYWLSDAAATAFNRMEAEQGFIDLNSAGRTRAEQDGLLARWAKGGKYNRPPYLYKPAQNSMHIGGNAFDTSEYNRVKKFASRYGFRWVGSHDPVHFDYVGGGGSVTSVSQDVKNRQAWLNKSRGEKLTVDGILGEATKAAIRRYQAYLRASWGYSGAVDGIWGAGTQTSHQRYYDSYNSQGAALKVDGAWGAATTKRLQAVLGVKQDSIFGPQTIRALQTKIGAPVDGVFGPISKKRLQAYLGVTQDGIIGAQSVKALQQRLNGGKF